MIYTIGMYRVATEQFSGPLEKLLELIEHKKLDITSISLADVTADFIAYAKDLKDKVFEMQRADDQGPIGEGREFARLVSDFLVIAAQLLLIKSRAILPQSLPGLEEEEDSFDLERQLRVYSAMKPVFGELKKFWVTSDQSFSREYLKTQVPVFYPPRTISSQDLSDALERAAALVKTFVKEEQKIERQLITLEEKISEISRAVLGGVQKFSTFAKERDKHEVIVLFLAILHLLRDRSVRVKQDAQFGDIEFSAHGNDA